MDEEYGDLHDDITDVPGIRVGHWTDPVGLTGCSVVLPPPHGAVAAVDVRGAAPGTRETDLLAPGRLVERVHAVVLAGGSAFGLAAADGVMSYLAERGVGLPTGHAVVPIVPAAVVYDLGVGSAQARPDAAAGVHACVDAEPGSPCGNGLFGAGTGATVGKLLGPDRAVDGGIGTASRALPGGGVVAAMAVVNAVGDVVAADGTVLAGVGAVETLLADGLARAPLAAANTTLVVVATDVVLTRTRAHRLAVVSHDGLALAVRPVHTSYDGDTVFVLSTADGTGREEEPVVLETAAVEVVARAIRNAVATATMDTVATATMDTVATATTGTVATAERGEAQSET
ncbi:P1 family peptidase [Nocardioides mesophilus]|uniref:P1 family peptidase n=1 Tax=Nocardioides mesophilus TaxID=433659 RepID=A0A7G9R900_9ACTN|nr:P1 family peptidase [Nocardioides mesophilus]QNN52075.1 P1 family peptidase [Nocardioides mesophilus]